MLVTDYLHSKSREKSQWFLSRIWVRVFDWTLSKLRICPSPCPTFFNMSDFSNRSKTNKMQKTVHWYDFVRKKCSISNFVHVFPDSALETLLLDVNNIVSSAVQSAGCTLIKIFGINQIFVKFKIQIVNMSHIYESRWTWEFDFDAVRWCFIDRCMYTVQTQVQRSFENSFFELTDNLTFLQQQNGAKTNLNVRGRIRC